MHRVMLHPFVCVSIDTQLNTKFVPKDNSVIHEHLV